MRRLRRLFKILVGLVVLAIIVLAGAIAFGTASPPQPLPSMQAAGNRIAESLRASPPPQEQFVAARDGVKLAYRLYAGDAKKVAVLVHGSSGSSVGVHGLAVALQKAGWTVYAPDIRGHGSSGKRGDIAYIGQLDDDIEDLAAEIAKRNPDAKRALIGHSSGGGFALRIAAGAKTGKLFDGYIFLAPFLGVDSPSQRANAGGWVAAYVPRIVGLTILTRLGIDTFNGLDAVAFAVRPEDTKFLVAFYSFRLLANFGPHQDWRADLRAVAKPAIIVAGGGDELFFADKFEAALGEAQAKIPVLVVPGVDHMGITLDAKGQEAIIGELAKLAS